MFFLTEQDPNFRIKGSRDPLGFQPIWQALGRTVIKHLSTVSNNIKDFQVLSYAWYFYDDRDPKDFLNFFYKFEQACGFARGEYIKDDAFNGIDFVRKNLAKGLFTFSTRNQDTLLSNQKSYGIHGKYNRPFSEMKIKEQDDFKSVIEGALRSKVHYLELEGKVKRLLEEDIVRMGKDDIKIFADILTTLSEGEKEFFQKLILKVEGNHVQNELFELLYEFPALINVDSFNLFSFIDSVSEKNITEQLKLNLTEITNSEHVLLPYVYLFKTIQSSPLWTEEEITSKEIFNSFPKSMNYSFSNPVIDQLNIDFDKSPYEIAVAAVDRNKDVSDRRGNAAWIKKEYNKLMVCYADGGRETNEFDSDVAFEHNYFLPSYISMYKQIMS